MSTQDDMVARTRAALGWQEGEQAAAQLADELAADKAREELVNEIRMLAASHMSCAAIAQAVAHLTPDGRVMHEDSIRRILHHELEGETFKYWTRMRILSVLKWSSDPVEVNKALRHAEKYALHELGEKDLKNAVEAAKLMIASQDNNEEELAKLEALAAQYDTNT